MALRRDPGGHALPDTSRRSNSDSVRLAPTPLGASMKKSHIVAGAAALCISFAAMAADPIGTRPSDRKAREILSKVVSVPTQIGNDKVPEMAEYLAGEFRAAGIPADDVKVVPFTFPDDRTATLVVRYRGDGRGGKPILLMAHMDVVTAKREEWERDRYQLIEEGGFFFGRGSYDNKAGLAAIVATVLRLKAEGFKPNRDLIVYFSGDEETSQRTTVEMVRDHRDLIDAELCDESDEASARSMTTASLRSSTVCRLPEDLRGFLAHSSQSRRTSSMPRADNAIYELAAAPQGAGFKFPVMPTKSRSRVSAGGKTARGKPARR